MIIQRIFHTYRDDFPLLSDGRLPVSYDASALDALFISLILELSDLTSFPRFTYITRHTKDKIPPKHLDPFLTKFQDFVDCLGKTQSYNIPTVWFVGYFEDQDIVTEFRRKIDEKNIKYFEEGGEYGSFEEINDSYWNNKRDAQLFPKFLNQVTMIGIDLLSASGFKQKLKQLERLEFLQYSSIADMESDLKEMELYFNENSPYYRKRVNTKLANHKEFWGNFTKVKITETRDGGQMLGSWPHFLFNICGVLSQARNLPIVRM